MCIRDSFKGGSFEQACNDARGYLGHKQKIHFGKRLSLIHISAQAVHADLDEQRRRLGRVVQDIADDGLFGDGIHKSFLAFIGMVLLYPLCALFARSVKFFQHPADGAGIVPVGRAVPHGLQPVPGVLPVKCAVRLFGVGGGRRLPVQALSLIHI